ncbi:MAG: response regulator, partial [Alphaproteobacteria bacterium]|nr:response regulator [Alphaproteobacteria bacterium]
MTARVLVVDDLLPNVRLLEAKLTAEYYDVLTATDGPTALERVRKETPDIVLLDVMMPGMDGFAVCRAIKEDPQTAHIPVVMVTALSDSSNRVRGLQVGADDFLTKPVNDVALLARVRSLVRLKMMMDEWRMREETYGSFGMQALGHNREEEAGQASVLVIDDSEVSIGKILKALDRDGNKVVAARSARQAFEAAR